MDSAVLPRQIRIVPSNGAAVLSDPARQAYRLLQLGCRRADRTDSAHGPREARRNRVNGRPGSNGA